MAVILAVLAINFNACKEDAPPPPKPKITKPKVPQVPVFNKDSAYQFIQSQVDFGPRVLGSEGHKQCRDWLGQQLKNYGAEVVMQDFDAKVYTGKTFPATNIIGRFNPSSPNRIMLAAHWDTRHVADSKLTKERKEEPILGADDGGSGVGVLLEIARHLQTNPLDIGIDIVFFDAEDYGQRSDIPPTTQEEANRRTNTWALGAQYWAKNVPTTRPKFGILLDMVGAHNARFAKEAYSMQAASSLVNQIWGMASTMGFGDYFVDTPGGAITDDHYFVMTHAQIPMIDIINTPENSENNGFGHHWHTHKDNMEIISPRTLRAVGQVVTAFIYRQEIVK